MVNGDMVLIVSSSLFLLLIVQCRITGLLGRDKRMPSLVESLLLLQEIPSLRFLGFSDSALDHCITFYYCESVLAVHAYRCTHNHISPTGSHSFVYVDAYLDRR